MEVMKIFVYFFVGFIPDLGLFLRLLQDSHRVDVRRAVIIICDSDLMLDHKFLLQSF